MSTKKEITPSWIKISTVAAKCDTTPTAVRDWIRRGLLRQAGTGEKLRFVTYDSFERFLKDHS